MSTEASRIFIAVAVVLAAAASPLEAQSAPTSLPLRLLDVPYLPQSEDLCGGAAAAMVMRYWGAQGVYAESFADLVNRDAGGIRAQDLLDAVRSRGWAPQAFRGDDRLVGNHLDRRRPVIALLEDRPGRFHYVVIVGWRGGKVFFHDPARAPFRILEERRFAVAWEAAGFWAAVLLPASRGTITVPAARDAPAAGASNGEAGLCAGMVDEGVRLAGAGERDAARELFEAARSACPAAAAPWREIAGLHALDGAWRQAARHAREAVARDPHDRHAWRILATGLYLERDYGGALGAWNQLGEPMVDLVNISGLDRTRYGVAASMLGIQPRTLLTPGALRAAERRLSDLPSAQIARVSYRPVQSGLAHVDAAIVERSLLPASLAALSAMGVRIASDREVSVSVANPTGGGEVWTASWRWWTRRERIAVAFAAPAAGAVWRLDAFDDRQAYGDLTDPIDERRRGGSIGMSRWLTSGTRIDLAAGIDAWRGSGRSTSVRGKIAKHLAKDTIEVTADAGAWLGSVRTWTAGLGGGWRSSTTRDGHVWLVRGGFDAAGERAPRALWAGAGTGQGRETLLRAHPLLTAGIISHAVFGRRLLHGGIESRWWTRPRRLPVRVAPAVFIDAARAFTGLPASDTRTHVDAGGGLRIALPGASAIRIDVARGLRDGHTAFSIGWSK